MKTQLNMKKNLDKFIPITKVVDYNPPKFVENWDGSFNKIKIGKTYYFRPNKEFSNFKLKINENNLLNLKTNSEGIYVIVDKYLKYFYILDLLIYHFVQIDHFQDQKVVDHILLQNTHIYIYPFLA